MDREGEEKDRDSVHVEEWMWWEKNITQKSDSIVVDVNETDEPFVVGC